MTVRSLRGGWIAARCRIRSWVGLGLGIGLGTTLLPSPATANNQFRLEGWANAQALLLAPEARPGWLIDSPAEPNEFAVSIDREESVRARILIRILASPNGQAMLVGRGDRYIFAPVGASKVLEFPIYIVTPATAQQDCTLRISGASQSKPYWRFADNVDFSLQCDEKSVARYSAEITGKAGPAPLAKRLVSRWIRDPDGSHGYALLLVQEAVKAALQDDLKTAANPQRKATEIAVCAHRDVLTENAVQPPCELVLLATLLNQSLVTAKHLEPRISKQLERSSFEDFALPFTEKRKGVSLTAILRLLPPEKSFAILLYPSIDHDVPNIAETPSPAGRPQASAPNPPTVPAQPAAPTRRELRVEIKNSGEACARGQCPIKVAGTSLTVNDLGRRIVVDKTVDIEFTDDWTATKASLFSVAKSKPDEDITKFVDDNVLKLSDNTAPYGGPGIYDLILTLQKREKLVQWSVYYDPPPQRFTLPEAPNAYRSIVGRTDYPLLIDQIPARPQSYINYRLISPAGAPSPTAPLPKDGFINLPYPARGKELAEYKIVLSPPLVSEPRLQALRFQLALSFGRHKYPLTPGCQAEIFLTYDSTVRFRLKAAANDKFSLTLPAATARPIIYVPDQFALELKDASCDPFPAGAKLNIGRPFSQDSSDIEIPLSVESQAYVAYVAGIEGNDGRYLQRLATYLSFVDDIYKTGYSKDTRSPDSWIYGTIFGQSIRDNFILLQQPRFPTGAQLIDPNDLEKLAQQAYQSRHAPEAFDRIADKLLDQMTPERNGTGQTPWTLVYLDESFSVTRKCESYNAPIEKLKSNGLKRAVIVALSEMDGVPLAADGNVRRCNLDQNGQFRVYSLPRKMLVETGRYALLDSIKDNMKDWTPKKPGR